MFLTACASAPPAPQRTPVPAGPPFEQKMSWILRLEDQRVLRDLAAPVPPAAPVVPARGRTTPTVVAQPVVPDLIQLLADPEARIRRRAALAVGRIALPDGVPPLVALLSDKDAEVRQMAAFALGLIGDRSARDPLVLALDDPSEAVKGSAAEALGLLGDATAADAIGRVAARLVESGAVSQPPANDDEGRRDTAASAFRLAVYALVRLKAYPQLSAAVLDGSGAPRVRWWPVAYALQRIDDARALPALLALARDAHPYTRAFAVKGLGGIKDRAALPVLLPLLTSGDRTVLIETIRALGRIGDASVVPALLKLLHDGSVDPQVRLELVSALGGFQPAPAGLYDQLLDVVTDSSPAVRAAALRSVAAIDPDAFVTILSGLDPDPHWTVRAALATVLGNVPAEFSVARLRQMLTDADQRVVPAVLASIVKHKTPDAVALATDRLKAEDPIVRSAAATAIGDLLPPNGAAALADAYRYGERDPMYAARVSALVALVKFGAGAALPVLRTALADKDWAVRVRAAMLIRQLDPAAGAEAIAQMRPAPTTVAPEVYQSSRLVTPSVSTQLYLDTDRGTIQIELAVIDAPLTVENFVTLARRGYFDGLAMHRVVPGFVVQDGDPRGDGEGGPGYTIRDEFNQLPYLRGTVGVALDPWADTGGSQYFITHAPQPHLDARYTVFGRVIAGMEVVDQLQQWDVVRRVRVWDGQTMTGGK